MSFGSAYSRVAGNGTRGVARRRRADPDLVKTFSVQHGRRWRGSRSAWKTGSPGPLPQAQPRERPEDSAAGEMSALRWQRSPRPTHPRNPTTRARVRWQRARVACHAGTLVGGSGTGRLRDRRPRAAYTTWPRPRERPRRRPCTGVGSPARSAGVWPNDPDGEVPSSTKRARRRRAGAESVPELSQLTG